MARLDGKTLLVTGATWASAKRRYWRRKELLSPYRDAAPPDGPEAREAAVDGEQGKQEAW